jgi:hypothetical protein
MEGPVGHLNRLFHELARIEIVAERAAGDLRQLTIVTVGKDRKILPTRSQVCS